MSTVRSSSRLRRMASRSSMAADPSAAAGPGAGGGAPTAVVDVHYPAAGGTVGAAVMCADCSGAVVVGERVVRLARAAPYEPGAFARRELPTVLALLAWT